MKRFYSEENILKDLYFQDLEQIRLLNIKIKHLKEDYSILFNRYNNLKKLYEQTLILLRKEKEKNDNNV